MSGAAGVCRISNSNGNSNGLKRTTLSTVCEESGTIPPLQTWSEELGLERTFDTSTTRREPLYCVLRALYA